MREVKLTLKETFICWIETIFLLVLGMFAAIGAVAIFAAITVGVVMSGMWTASLFK